MPLIEARFLRREQVPVGREYVVGLRVRGAQGPHLHALAGRAGATHGSLGHLPRAVGHRV